MAKKRKKKDEVRKGSFSESYFRFSLTLFIISAVLYIAAQLIARTAGFLYLLEDRISEALGLEVSIEEAQLSPGLKLQMKGLSSKDSQKRTEPSVSADEVEANIDFSSVLLRQQFRLDTLTIDGLVLALVPDDKGRWQPGILGDAAGRLTEWVGVPSQVGDSGVSGSGRSTESVKQSRAQVPPVDRVSVRNGKVRWRTAGGVSLAAMDGFELSITAVKLPRSRMTHFDLSVDSLQKPRGETMEFVTAELLSGNDGYIVMGYNPGRLIKPITQRESSSVSEEPTGIQEVLREAIE